MLLRGCREDWLLRSQSLAKMGVRAMCPRLSEVAGRRCEAQGCCLSHPHVKPTGHGLSVCEASLSVRGSAATSGAPARIAWSDVASDTPSVRARTTNSAS